MSWIQIPVPDVAFDSTDENTRDAMSLSSSSSGFFSATNSDALVRKTLTKWWITAAKEDKAVTPVKWVAFVDACIDESLVGISAGVFIPLTLDDIERDQGVDFADKLLLVFFSAPKSGWSIHILGTASVQYLKDAFFGRQRRPLLTSYLWKSLTFDVRPFLSRMPSVAAKQNKNYWFRLPVSAPVAVGDGDVDVEMDVLSYRMDLMLCFWENRSNRVFADTDSYEMLKTLHEGPDKKLFDLTTDVGRDREYTAYWCLAFVCSHSTRLWRVWLHWEMQLLRFRVERYFCKEFHFRVFIVQNKLNVSEMQMLETVNPREKDLYRQRNPSGPMPSLWIRVHVSTVGPDIARSPLYDVADGHVYLTYKDFAPWIWHQMEHHAEEYFRKNHHAHVTKQKPEVVTSTRFENIPFMVSYLLTKANEKFAQQDKSGRGRGVPLFGAAVAPENVTDVEGLIEVAKHKFPLCMSQIVRDALVYGKHPKHGARTSFVMFLLTCGLEKDAVNRIMYLLFAADEKFVTHWMSTKGKQYDKIEYDKDFGLQVKSLHERVVVNKTAGSYGCRKLVEDGRRGEPHGCPFTWQDTEATVELLKWSDSSVPDIEDIMRPASEPGERCCRDRMAKYKGENPVTVWSPARFMGILPDESKRAKFSENGK
jgi:hypothetical protein